MKENILRKVFGRRSHLETLFLVNYILLKQKTRRRNLRKKINKNPCPYSRLKSTDKNFLAPTTWLPRSSSHSVCLPKLNQHHSPTRYRLNYARQKHSSLRFRIKTPALRGNPIIPADAVTGLQGACFLVVEITWSDRKGLFKNSRRDARVIYAWSGCVSSRGACNM